MMFGTDFFYPFPLMIDSYIIIFLINALHINATYLFQPIQPWNVLRIVSHVQVVCVLIIPGCVIKPMTVLIGLMRKRVVCMIYK